MAPIGGPRSGIVGGGIAIPDSVVNRWPYDEGSGTTVADSVGSADGTITGATWVSGAGNGGFHLDFDGTDDQVQTPAVPATGSANRTLACWVNLDAYAAADTLIEYGNDAVGERFTLRLSPELRVEIRGDGDASTLSLPTDSWVPVACVLDGSFLEDVTVYLDGTTEQLSGTAEQVNTASGTGAGFGYDPVNNSGRHFDGGIDDPIFWDRALTTAELDDWASATAGNYS